MKLITSIGLLFLLLAASPLAFPVSTRLDYEEVEPRFSADGTKLAFSSNKGGRNHIWIKNVDGKLRHQITKLNHDMEPNWSPDGKQIVFASYGKTENGPFAIWVVNTDGTNPKELIKPAGDNGDQYPAWSPDGQHIAFSHGNALWIMDKNGGNAHALNGRNTGFQYCGQWSPDGQHIAYMEVSVGNDYKISVINADGKEGSLISTGIVATQVRWSSDGKYLFFSNGEGIFKIGADGKGTPTKLIDTKNGEADFDISPDGKTVAYDDGGPDGTGKLFLKKLP